jgi:hypothetical protein
MNLKLNFRNVKTLVQNRGFPKTTRLKVEEGVLAQWELIIYFFFKNKCVRGAN